MWYLLVLYNSILVNGILLFRPEQFTDLTSECRRSEGQKPIRRILNEINSSAYISIDPSQSIKQRFTPSSSNSIRRLINSNGLAEFDFIRKINVSLPNVFNCILQIETQLPNGDKDTGNFDALSLIIIELNQLKSLVQISTIGYQNHGVKNVTESAHYSDREWSSSNPNFLLSGQLSGFDSVDYKSKINPQHIVKPEELHSSWDQPARINVNLTNWSSLSYIYMIFTSYKYIQRGSCEINKEYDCYSPSKRTFLGSEHNKHLCMSALLACDGLPNCGQDFLPNSDENCFEINWTSVLISFISYLFLALILLFCLGCFARLLIQWSFRSSLAGEFVRVSTPVVDSSRFFSFFGLHGNGGSSGSRWERPPPTYDEAMKHVNPDMIERRLSNPPAYTDSSLEMESSALPPPPPIPLLPPPNYCTPESTLTSISCPTLNAILYSSSNEVQQQQQQTKDDDDENEKESENKESPSPSIAYQNKYETKGMRIVEADVCVFN